MSVSNGKENLNIEKGNEVSSINNESQNLLIKNIYPKSKLIPRVNALNNKIDFKKNEKNGEFFELNKEFLFALVQPIFLLDKQKMYSTIANLIKNSKFLKKIEIQSEIKENINSLITIIVKNLSFVKIEKNNILYHIGESDDKFYFIIKGRMSELKANKFHLKISFEEYICYLIELQKNNEIYILNEVLLENKDVPIKSIDNIKKIYNVIFKKKLIEKISLEKISNNTELEAFFNQYYQELSSYNLSKKELKKLEKDKNKIIMGSVNRDWDDYILEQCHPNSDDLLLFEPFEELFKNDQKSYVCYKYEITENISDGDYFGDFSLDEDKIIRTETVRAEENTFLGLIANEDYVNIVSPSRKIEKQKEIALLNNSSFFKYISERIFKKNYYEMFVKREYGMNTILFNFGEKPKSLIFLKKGKISLVLNCSILELYNLIQMIYIKLNKITWPYDTFQKKILTKEELKMIEKKYFNEPILKKIKTFNKIFKFELEKKRKFQLALFSDLEIIGLEEIYLKMPYVAKGIVIGDKIICNELPLDKFNIILQEEIRNITESYVKASINRVLSLMERLHNLKQNFMNIAKIKSENSSSDNNMPNNINKSLEKNKYKIYKIRPLNVINSLINNKLHINNSKTLISQNISIKNEVWRTKTENNDAEKYSYKNSRVNSTKLKTGKIASLIRIKNDRIISSYRKLSSKKKINNLKSAIKMNNKFELEKNDISERAGSVKLKKYKKGENEERTPQKNKDIIIIGNNKINIRKLKKKINEYQSVDNISEKFCENNELNYLSSPKDNYYIKIEEQNKNESLIKETFLENIIYKKLNTLKANKTNIKDENKKYISIINTSESTFNKERFNSIDFKDNKMKKKDYTKLLINKISPKKSLDLLNKRNIRNKKPLNINDINKKNFIISNNTTNNVSVINQTTNTYTNRIPNNDISILSILPKIQRKTKYNDYLSNTSNSNFNKKTITGKIPEIVKDYYSQIKKKGYIPLIANKEFNTIFLRKYHKKYMNVVKEHHNKSLNKNDDNVLPKI